jgi:hypothetical protein
MARREELEIWENRNRSEFWVMKEDLSGQVVPVRIAPGKQIEISTYDRQRNQEQTVDPKFDWFTNGALSQVKLIDTADDIDEIKANPNTKSETELRELLNLNANELKKELAQITSPLVLARLKEFIESDDSDKAEGLTVAKSKAVMARYEELHPSVTGKVFDTYEEAIAKPRKLS